MDAKDRKIADLERVVAEQSAMIEKRAQRVMELERALAKARKEQETEGLLSEITKGTKS